MSRRRTTICLSMFMYEYVRYLAPFGDGSDIMGSSRPAKFDILPRWVKIYSSCGCEEEGTRS
jgi:hypothetical protein